MMNVVMKILGYNIYSNMLDGTRGWGAGMCFMMANMIYHLVWGYVGIWGTAQDDRVSLILKERLIFFKMLWDDYDD